MMGVLNWFAAHPCLGTIALFMILMTVSEFAPHKKCDCEEKDE